MAEGELQIELKFRIYDGTDISHGTYALSTSVATLKERLVAEWPQDKTVTPKSVDDVKLIHAGRILENNTTLADARVTMGDLPTGVITMHIVVQPSVAKKKKDASTIRDDAKSVLLVAIRSSSVAIAIMRPWLSVHAATPSRRLLKFCAHCWVKMGEYFCNICEFHGDDISKGQFHYDDCGIGRSLSLSNVYCESTGSRYSISAHNDRVCIENSMKNYCPVCYEVPLPILSKTVLNKS